MASPPRVLVVDDEERFRSTMCKLLNHQGLTAVPVGSGLEALEEVKRNSYDVVILDVRMPEIGGVEVLSNLKKIDPHLEVIILTGYASVDTAKQILELGAYDYVLKPYAIDELIGRIEAAYERKATRIRFASNPAQGKENSK